MLISKDVKAERLAAEYGIDIGIIRSILEEGWDMACEAIEGDEAHEGWQNYETYAVAVWLLNNRMIEEDVKGIIANREQADPQGEVKTFLEDLVLGEVDTKSLKKDEMYHFVEDILYNAFDRINWGEIVSYLVEKDPSIV